jgi:Cd2+/Zn2+-exporting ATPase/Cu+-exporting ATPase
VVAKCREVSGPETSRWALEIRVERIGRDTSYGRIIEAVENAERSRAPVQQLVRPMQESPDATFE